MKQLLTQTGTTESPPLVSCTDTIDLSSTVILGLAQMLCQKPAILVKPLRLYIQILSG